MTGSNALMEYLADMEWTRQIIAQGIPEITTRFRAGRFRDAANEASEDIKIVEELLTKHKELGPVGLLSYGLAQLYGLRAAVWLSESHDTNIQLLQATRKDAQRAVEYCAECLSDSDTPDELRPAAMRYQAKAKQLGERAAVLLAAASPRR